MALLATILQGALAGAFVGGAISGAMGVRAASREANRIDGAEDLNHEFVLPVMELQTHVGVAPTARLVRLLNHLCQLSAVVGSGVSRKVLLTTADEAHRKRQAVLIEVSKLWARHVTADTPDAAATKLQELFDSIKERTNQLVNNVDVAVDRQCGASALPNPNATEQEDEPRPAQQLPVESA
jgi:hypothetical protein